MQREGRTKIKEALFQASPYFLFSCKRFDRSRVYQCRTARQECKNPSPSVSDVPQILRKHAAQASFRGKTVLSYDRRWKIEISAPLTAPFLFEPSALLRQASSCRFGHAATAAAHITVSGAPPSGYGFSVSASVSEMQCMSGRLSLISITESQNCLFTQKTLCTSQCRPQRFSLPYPLVSRTFPDLNLRQDPVHEHPKATMPGGGNTALIHRNH